MCAEEGKPPADLSLLLVLNPVIYSALLPPPAATGSCSNYCSSGDTDGNVSLSGKKKNNKPSMFVQLWECVSQDPPVFHFYTEVQ